MLEFTPSTTLLDPPLLQFLEQFQQVSFLHLYTCVYIIRTIFILLPIPCHLPPPTSAKPPCPVKNLFCHPVPQSYRRKNIKDKKRNIVFLA
jgi:hypothetical protein